MDDTNVTDASRIIQTALTPVFLLSGVGTLLGMFNLRVNTLSDHLEHLNDLLLDAEPEQRSFLLVHMRRLRLRLLALDAASVLGAFAGVVTCIAAFALFVVTLRALSGQRALLWLFGVALACTVAALGAFLVDTVLAWHGLRQEGPMPRPKQRS